MTPNPDLHAFLTPYSESVQEIAIWLRNFVTDLIPEANELIWDNYNAVAIAYSKSEQLKDAFCHIAVYSKHVNFGFNRGAELSKTSIVLEGKGKLIRHIKVTNVDMFPKKDIQKMLLEAVDISERQNPDLVANLGVGKSKVMSVSQKKVRPKKSDN